MKNRVRVTENCYIDLEKSLIVGAKGQTDRASAFALEVPEVSY